MSFVIKMRGAPTRTLIAEYECPVHGRFACEVERDENGDPPSVARCSVVIEDNGEDEEWLEEILCGQDAEYRISAPLGRVNRISAIRGKSEKPERETWLDTTNIAEGQPLYEFHEDRAAIRERQRQREYIELRKRGDI